jgi:hypothetical protein
MTKRHHFFLFRHCVRSTPSTVNFYDANSAVIHWNVSDLTASPLPDWNTPEAWCTEEGMKRMKRTGQFVLEKILLTGSSSGTSPATATTTTTKRLKVRFISDTSMRDVDTAFALSMGMANSTADVAIDGLYDQVYDPDLFNPLRGKNKKKDIVTRDGGPLCETLFDEDRHRSDIEHRLKTLAQPTKLSLHDALVKLQTLGGMGAAGPLADLLPEDITLNADMKLVGPVNAVKLLSQMMFYSRASGIDPPYLPKATQGDVYDTVAWLYWLRSVAGVGNVKSANKGAVLARVLLATLETGHYARDGGQEPSTDYYDTTATFIVGHDGNIDSLSTVLGIQFDLDFPYRYDAAYISAPPGSAIHISYSVDDGKVELSYLYPSFSKGNDDDVKWNLNANGKLRSVPLLFVPPLEDADAKVSAGETYTLLSSNKSRGPTKHTGVDILRDRILSILQDNPGATECFEAAASQPPLELNKVGYMGIVAASLAGFACLCLAMYWCFYRRNRDAKAVKYGKIKTEIELA